MNILITGRPGVGKTSVLNKIKDAIKAKEYDIGGIFSPEIKEDNKRVGFSIIDVESGKRGILAHIKGSGPNVGKYKVIIKDLNEIGVPAIKKAIINADFIIIDEIAPMELKSKEFCASVEAAFSSSKPVLAVIHKRSKHPFVSFIKNRDDVIIFEVTPSNRDSLHLQILETLGMIQPRNFFIVD